MGRRAPRPLTGPHDHPNDHHGEHHADLDLTEILHTLHPATTGHDWSAGVDRRGTRRDSLFPFAGDDVVADDGRIGVAMHTIPGRPVLPPRGEHRYAITADNGFDRALPVLAYHVSRLRPSG